MAVLLIGILASMGLDKKEPYRSWNPIQRDAVGLIGGGRTACTGTNKSSQRKNRQVPGYFDKDSTIIRLLKSLAKKFPAALSRTVAAGVKASLLVSAVANNPKSISIHPESANELKTLQIGPWIKDRILLIDLGFYKNCQDQRGWRLLRVQVEGKC